MKHFHVFKITIGMYECIKKVHLLITQLILGVGVERMLLGGSSGRPRSSIWGASDQTDSKWTARLSAWWRWTCFSTESPKAVIFYIRTFNGDSETQSLCKISSYALTSSEDKSEFNWLWVGIWCPLHELDYTYGGWKIALRDWWHGTELLQESVATEAVKMEKLRTRQFFIFHQFGIRLCVHRKFGIFCSMWRIL